VPDQSEKAKRKALRLAMRERQRDAVRASLPAPASLLRGLFSFLDTQLSETECDHTLRFTRVFLATKDADDARVIAWLQQHGGYCDCEALNNAEEVLEDALSGDPD
jgi:hypothetical protein